MGHSDRSVILHSKTNPICKYNSSNLWTVARIQPTTVLALVVVCVLAESSASVSFSTTAVSLPMSGQSFPNCVLANTSTVAAGSVAGAVSLAYDPESQSVYSYEVPQGGLYKIDNDSGALTDFAPQRVYASMAFMAANPVNGEIIASNQTAFSSTTRFYASATGQEVARLPFFMTGAAMDPSTGDLLLSTLSPLNWGFRNATIFANLTWVNAGSDTVVRSVELWGRTTEEGGGLPPPSAFDPQDGEWFVGGLPGNLTVLDATTGTILGNVSLGFIPMHMVFDPVNGDIYVSGENGGINGSGAGVVVVNPSTRQVVGQVSGLTPLPLDGAGMAVDPTKGTLFLSGASTVFEVSAATNAVEGSFGTPQLLWGLGGQLLAYDLANQRLYVGSHDANLVVEPGVSCPSPTASGISWSLLPAVAATMILIAAVVVLLRRNRRREVIRPEPAPPSAWA